MQVGFEADEDDVAEGGGLAAVTAPARLSCSHCTKALTSKDDPAQCLDSS